MTGRPIMKHDANHSAVRRESWEVKSHNAFYNICYQYSLRGTLKRLCCRPGYDHFLGHSLMIIKYHKNHWVAAYTLNESFILNSNMAMTF